MTDSKQFKQSTGKKMMSSLWKCMAVTGLLITQGALAQGEAPYNRQVAEAWSKGDMATVKSLCPNVAWLVRPYRAPETLQYCAKDVGDPNSMAALGLSYTDSEGKSGFKMNPQQAFYWSMESANRGNGFGMSTLGMIYYEGFGVEKDLAKASGWCVSAAQANVKLDICNTIRREASARGIAPTPMQMAAAPVAPPGNTVAVDANGTSAKPAAAANVSEAPDSPEAKLRLAKRYEYGHGLPKDLAKAIELYRQLADLGQPEAQYRLGSLYRDGAGVQKDRKAAIKWYRLAANQGYMSAQSALGLIYLVDRDGVAKDEKESAKWFRLAADQGDEVAQHVVGWAYSTGKGVPQDKKEAGKWYRLAADQGNGLAQIALGFLYYEGKGVPQNDTEALKWFRLAAAGDQAKDKQLNNVLGTMYLKGEGTPRNYTEALKWYRINASQGDSSGMIGACLAYLVGKPGTEGSVKKEEIDRWCKEGQKNGTKEEKKLIIELQNEKTSPPRDTSNNGDQCYAKFGNCLQEFCPFRVGAYGPQQDPMCVASCRGLYQKCLQ